MEIISWVPAEFLLQSFDKLVKLTNLNTDPSEAMANG